MTSLLRRLLLAALVVVGFLGTAPIASAQAFPDLDPAYEFDQGLEETRKSGEPRSVIARAVASDPNAETDEASVGGQDGRLSTALEIALLLTALSLLPAVLITLTSFTRIVIVLSFVRRALSLNELPPNQILIGLALFLTIFVMAPVGQEVWEEAWVPYDNGEQTIEESTGKAWSTMSRFLVANTRESEMRLFAELADSEETFAFLDGNGGEGVVLAGEPSALASISPGVQTDDLPLTVVIPAFILSELKTAFQMGFLLFLPFLVIDLVVASILLSMGMFMLPPVMISTPIKVLVFVLVDGWKLVTESVVTSFVQVVGA